MEHIFETVYPEYKNFKNEIELNSKQFLLNEYQSIYFYFSFDNEFLQDKFIKKIFQDSCPRRARRYNIELKLNNKIYKVSNLNGGRNLFNKEDFDKRKGDYLLGGYISFILNPNKDFFKFLTKIGCNFEAIFPLVETYKFKKNELPYRYQQNYPFQNFRIDNYGNSIMLHLHKNCNYFKYYFISNINLRRKNSIFNFFMKCKYNCINLETFYENNELLIEDIKKKYVIINNKNEIEKKKINFLYKNIKKL